VRHFRLTMFRIRLGESRLETSLESAVPPIETGAVLRWTPRKLRVRLILSIATSSVLIGAGALANDGGAGQSYTGPAMQADRSGEALLHQLEKQIAIGHTIGPEADNAVNTWHHFLQVVSLNSTATQRALADFATSTRRRAADEQAAGRSAVASDLLVFADQAAGLVRHQSDDPAPSFVPPTSAATDASASSPPTHINIRDSPPPRPSAEPPELSESEVRQAPLSAAGPARTGGSVASAEPDRNSPVTDHSKGETGAANAVVAPHLDGNTKTGSEPAKASVFANRGDAMLKMKDIMAARGFYAYAASAGSARAAMALAETYDPRFLSQLDAMGTRPDLAAAADWYRKAAALGDSSANVRLQTMEAGLTK
jgi:hypothetical protein